MKQLFICLLICTCVCSVRSFAQVQPRAEEEEREDVEAREKWFWDQRRYPYDEIPAGARLDAIRTMQVMERDLQARKGGAQVQAANTWISVGPVNSGGRIRGLAIRPDGKIFVGAADGGVWSSTNKGTLWSTTFDKQPSLAMGAIAVDFSNPNIIYVGTGEITNNSDARTGAGIFKSTDGGATWQQSGLSNVGAFSKLFVNRQNPKIIYAAAAKSSSGFYRSTDAGATWTRTYTSTCYDMSVSPINSNLIYISSSSTIQRSNDGGLTFSACTTGVTLTSGQGTSIAVAPSDTNIVWCLVARSGGSSGGHIADIYRSLDKGTTWVLNKSYSTGSFFNSQGWYDNCIAVHPTKPWIVVAGGVGLYSTLDTGLTWSSRSGVHADQHIIEFDPVNPDVVYLGNDGGVYSSSNAGVSWTKISTTLPTTQFYHMDIDQSRPYRVFGGSQDNGSHAGIGTTDYVTQWTGILGGDGFYAIVDRTNPDIVYVEYQNGSHYRYDTKTKSATGIGSGISSSDAGSWSTPMAISPADNSTFYVGRTGLWRTRNARTGTPAWENLTAGNSSKISAIGLSPFDTSMMAIGTGSGEVCTSKGGGYAFQKRDSAGLPNRAVTAIVYDPVLRNRMYIVYSGYGSGHLYRSDDGGVTFKNVSGNLPNIPASSMDVDSADNRKLYIGTDIGVFQSNDAGTTWTPLTDGLPVSVVSEIRIHRKLRHLVASTYGRSMWHIALDTAATVSVPDATPVAADPSSVSITNVVPNPVRSEGSVSLGIRTRQHVVLELFSSSGESVARIAEGTYEQGTYTYPLTTQGLSSGIYYLKLSGSEGGRDVKSVVVVK